MTICYLEVDDEITTAIGRIRAVTDGEAVIVVPPGSRIATSRINFKLLAREGHERRLNVVAVSDEPAVRALAISAGLPTYDSLVAAEEALANFREQDRKLAARTGRGPGESPPPRAKRAQAETLVLPGLLVEAQPVEGKSRRESQSVTALGEGQPGPLDAGLSAGPSVGATDDVATSAGATSAGATGAGAMPLPGVTEERRVARRRGRPRTLPIAPVAVLVLLALLFAGVAYGAYVFLPTATIVLRPVTTELRPEPIRVTADTGVAVVDVAEGVVPAERIELPILVSGAFPSSGTDVRETRATGTVRFRSENTLNDVPVPADTRVSTPNGVEFVTRRTVTVPHADFASGTPGTVEVAVRAVRAGPRGNVEPGAITELPQALAGQLITVRNPEATSGGRRIEEGVVTEGDYSAAVASLTGQLDAALAASLSDTESIPRGLTAYAETARVTEARPEPQAAAVVGEVMPTFSISLRAVGQVVAVNEGLVDEVAAARLRAQLTGDQQVVGDEVPTSHARGQVADGRIVYEVSASAMVYQAPDSATLIGEVRGKTVGEAEAILSRYGMVEITMWPEFVDRLPEQNTRISLNIAPPSTGT